MRNGRSSCLVTENGLFLPDEIFCMILSWLEIKYLLRCTSVCKAWNAVLVENIQYIDMHAIHNRCRSDHIIIRRNKNKRVPGTLRRIDDVDDHLHVDLDGNKKKKKSSYLSYISCRGLLVLVETSPAPTMPETKYQYRICNPSTKRRLDLPRPHKGMIVMHVFLNSSTSSYHVVSLYNDNEGKVKFQLIDLGGQSNDPCPNEDLSWRTLNFPEYDVANTLQNKYDCRSCVFLEEGILFIPALGRVVSSNPMIVCIDLVQQASTTLNAPPESLGFENRKFIFQLWRGKPALSLVSEEKLNVWIVEDYKKQKWADPIIIPLPSLNENPLLKKQIPQIYQGDEEDFLVYNEYHKHSRIVIGYHVCKIGSEVLSYDPTRLPIRVPATLVSVKGMRPKNRKKRIVHPAGPDTTH